MRRYGWHLLLGWYAAAAAGPPGAARPAEDGDHQEEHPMTQTADGAVTLQGVTPYLCYMDAGAALDWSGNRGVTPGTQAGNLRLVDSSP